MQGLPINIERSVPLQHLPQIPANRVLGNNTDDRGEIVATQIQDGMISDDAVTESTIADDAVTGSKIADNAVDTSQLIDDAVTRAKLDTGTSATTAGNILTTTGDGMIWQGAGASVFTTYTTNDTISSNHQIGDAISIVGASGLSNATNLDTGGTFALGVAATQVATPHPTWIYRAGVNQPVQNLLVTGLTNGLAIYHRILEPQTEPLEEYPLGLAPQSNTIGAANRNTLPSVTAANANPNNPNRWWRCTMVRAGIAEPSVQRQGNGQYNNNSWEIYTRIRQGQIMRAGTPGNYVYAIAQGWRATIGTPVLYFSPIGSNDRLNGQPFTQAELDSSNIAGWQAALGTNPGANTPVTNITADSARTMYYSLQGTVGVQTIGERGIYRLRSVTTTSTPSGNSYNLWIRES